MSKKEEALKIAIQTFEWINKEYPVQEALDVCKEALKPHPKCDEACMFLCANEKKEWQKLDLEQQKNLYHKIMEDMPNVNISWWDFKTIYPVIEQKLKEKNS